MIKLATKEYWGEINGIFSNRNSILVFTTPNEGNFVCQSRLTLHRPPGPVGAATWIKHFYYYMKGKEKRVIQSESLAVDCVPIDFAEKAYFLIKRRDSGLLALPGGFIDPSDGITAKLSIERITAAAAIRELREETGANPSRVIPLGGPLREVINPASGQKPREYVTRTWPFAAMMKMMPLTPADDAQQAPGSAGLLPGWYRISDGIPAGFHFSHHIAILDRIFNKTFLHSHKFPTPVRKGINGMDRIRLQRIALAIAAATKRDYDLLEKGKKPILFLNPDFMGVDLAGLLHR